MASRIIGKIDLDQASLAKDLDTLRSHPRIEEAYDEFSSGYWKNCSLWNGSGTAADTTYRDLTEPALQTELGKSVPYLSHLVRQTFDMRRVTMVRARNLIDAMVVPHRDFVELEKPTEQYSRVFIVLEDNPAALHSDEASVFHMRPGEVWFLDAASVHAAVNFSTSSRESLCVDLAFDGPFEDCDIFSNQRCYRSDIDPDTIRRPPLDADYPARIRSLSKVIDADNFKDIVFLLSKVHFRKDVPITATYEWLTMVCQANGDRGLISKAEALRCYMIERRVMHERFSLTT